MRKCTKCKLLQSISEFRNDKSRSDGLSKWCKSCNKKGQQEWYQKNKEHARNTANIIYNRNKEIISAQRKIRYAKSDCKEKISAKQKKYYKENPDIHKERHWKYLGINMTMIQYTKMFNLQNKSCAICKRPASDFKYKLSVDHNHSTGATRGLLCLNCNRAIGYLKESIEAIENAKQYLIKYNIT